MPISFLRAVMLAAFVLPPGHLAAQGRLCDGRQVVTNTVAGAAMTQNIAVANPQYAQLAALVAAVDPDQQDWARHKAMESLRKRGFGNYDLFDLLFMQAKSGRQMKNGIEGATRVIGGTIVGGIAGSLAGRMTEGAIGGGIVGGMTGFAANQFVSIVVDDAVVQPVFDRLIVNPCEITASEALAEIARR